jgi:zinc protease
MSIFEKYPIPEFKPLKSTEFFVKESSIAATPSMDISWHGPDYRNDSAGTIAADVFSTILTLNSSKWKQALVDKGLATSTNASYQTLKFVGPINVSVLPNPNKLKECYTEVMNQLKLWGNDDYFTNEQLADAKAILTRNEIRRNEKPSSLASQLSYFWCSTSLDYFTDYNKNLQKITREDINNYIKKYIKDKPFVAGIILNAEMNKQANPSTFFKPSI